MVGFNPNISNSSLLANWWVIGLAGTLFVVEFLADKIPWVDTIWDTVHTFVRPLGAAAVAVTAVGSVNPSTMVVAGILTGGAALTSHSMKAMTRIAVNHSPEPVSNVFSASPEMSHSVWSLAHGQTPGADGRRRHLAIALFALLSVKIVRWVRRRALEARRKPHHGGSLTERLSGLYPAVFLVALQRLFEQLHAPQSVFECRIFRPARTDPPRGGRSACRPACACRRSLRCGRRADPHRTPPRRPAAPDP